MIKNLFVFLHLHRCRGYVYIKHIKVKIFTDHSKIFSDHTLVNFSKYCFSKEWEFFSYA